MTSTEVLHSYVSPVLLSRLAEGVPIDAPELRTVEAAVAAIDIEGFSPLVASMSSKGPAGIEELAALINSFFGSLVDTIHNYRGIVHTFPGDAVIALWPTGDLSLIESTHLAATCVKELTSGGGRALSALPRKAGLATGTIQTAHVGGVNNRWQVLVAGEALTQMGEAQQRARPGELVLSMPAWRLLRSEATAAEERTGFIVVESLSPISKPTPAAPTLIPPSCHDLLQCYLPDGLSARLCTDRDDWVGEFRRLSILFVLMEAHLGGQALDADLIHRSFQKIQEVVYRYEGGVVQICHDDKGVVVLAAMGLPGMAHEYDTQRAVMTALSIQAELERIRVDSSIGVATGRTFCGILGNRNRCEYSLVGSAVNRAARLMEEARRSILCDEASTKGSESRLSFKGPIPLRLKGFEGIVPAFRPKLFLPVQRRSESVASIKDYAVQAAPVPIVGRKPELEALGAWFDPVGSGWGGVLAIRGEAGIGKSLLARDLVSRARDAGMLVLVGYCDELNKGVAYHPWRSVLEQVLELRKFVDRDKQRAHLEDRVASITGDAALTPLLEAVFLLGLPENQITRQMVGIVRRDSTLALLSDLVRGAALRHRERGSTLLIVLEDLQWMDSASWALLDMLRRGGSDFPLGIAVTLREVPRFEMPGSETFLGADETNVVDLDVLTKDETCDLVKHRLGADKVSNDLSGLIYRRTQGNPFFCEELLTAMLEMKVIQVERGRARLIERGGRSAESVIPNSISDVLASRIDRLSDSLQLTLKAASVIGHPIEPEILCNIHPVESGLESVERQLEELGKLNLLRSDNNHVYFFKHVITSDVAYNRMLFSQRRQLHRAVAEHLEARDPNGVSSFTLYHHWRESGDILRALDYVDASGADAMHQGNYLEAIRLFEDALALWSEAGEDGNDDLHPKAEVPRTVLWNTQLGEAQVALGRHALGRSSLEIGLQGLGQPVPGGRLGVCVAITFEFCRQISHRLLPSWLSGLHRNREPKLLTSAEAYEQLGYIYYSACETLRGIHAALKMLNLSERAGITPALRRYSRVPTLP